MLRFSTWIISLLILFRTILTEDSVQHDKLHHYAPHDRVYTSRTGRFIFDLLENLRKNFCHSFCMSADNMPHFTNLMCAVKCPELYLPHSTTTPTSMLTPTSSIITTIATTPSPAIPGSQGTSQQQPPEKQPSSTTITSTTIASTTIASTTIASTTTASNTTLTSPSTAATHP
ncbi:hypothetical protein CAJAP_08586 [Camponotus japonicus]